MKKLLLIVFFMFCIQICKSQNVAEKYEGQNTYYCQVIAYKSALGKKVRMEIDYGQGLSGWKDERERDEVTGKVEKYESIIDVMNLMNSQGWEYVDLSVSIDQYGNTIYYLLLKKPII